MSRKLSLGIALAVVWGAVWASFLQFTRFGRWLALKRTWITVVVGVAGDGLIALLVTPVTVWLHIAAIVAASSAGIIARSWINEHTEDSTL